MRVFDRTVYLKRLKYDFPIYIVSTVLLCLVWIFLFNFKMKPNPLNSVNIFIASYNSSNEFEESLKIEFSTIEDFGMVYYDYQTQGFDEKLSIAGFVGSDILILPKEKVQGLIMEKLALEIDINKFKDVQYLTNKDVNYGILLNDLAFNKLKDSIKLKDTDYYIIINNKVTNIDKLENVYQVIKFIIGLK